jgi:RNA polymerase sigma-70 factor (sigma-E family)
MAAVGNLSATLVRQVAMDEIARAAFDSFARARTPALVRFATALCGDPHLAADLVQDALEKTGMAWGRVRRQDDPEGYVRRAIVHRHTSVWRKLRRERLSAALPERAANAATTHDAVLWAQLAALPPRQRAVLVLRFYEDLTEAQTAAVLGVAVGTVKSQTSKALATLRGRASSATEGDATWTA